MLLSCVRLFATPWTVAHQAPLSMGFSRQRYWSGISFPSPGDLPNPGMEPACLKSPALAGGLFYHWATKEAPVLHFIGRRKLQKKTPMFFWDRCFLFFFLIFLFSFFFWHVGYSLSHVQLVATPGTVAHQAPLSMGFSRQEYQSGLPCPLPGDLPDPGIKPTSLMSPALAGGFFSVRSLFWTWTTFKVFIDYNTASVLVFWPWGI